MDIKEAGGDPEQRVQGEGHQVAMPVLGISGGRPGNKYRRKVPCDTTMTVLPGAEGVAPTIVGLGLGIGSQADEEEGGLVCLPS